MAEMITRCPRCAVAFRISDAHLRSAKGIVRCGSCLSVFNAKDHIEPAKSRKPETSTPVERPVAHPAERPVMQPPAAVPATGASWAPQPPADTPREESAFSNQATGDTLEEEDILIDDDLLIDDDFMIDDDILIDDDLLIDDDIDDNALIYDSPDEGHIDSGSMRSDLFETGDSRAARGYPQQEDDADESWALELLKDDSDLNVKFRKIVASDDHGTARSPRDDQSSDGVQLDFGTHHNQPDADLSARTPPASPSTTAEAGAGTQRSLAPDFDPAPGHHNQPASAGNADITLRPSAEGSSRALARMPKAVAVVPAHKLTSPLDGQDEKTVTIKSGDATEEADDEGLLPKWEFLGAGDVQEELQAVQKLIASIEPETVEVGWSQNPLIWRKRLIWAGMALAALLVLLIQVAWLQFHRLNIVEPYRAFYSTACAVVGCTLPPMKDRSKIKTSNLYVRSHPSVADALLVDVVMQNVADYEQSFPNLLLTFTNLQNEAIAERKFSPEDYLGGELTGSDSMPVRTPVHVELEIVDPGEEAVSYSIAIID